MIYPKNPEKSGFLAPPRYKAEVQKVGLVLRYIVQYASGRCDYRRYFPTPLVPFVPGGQKLVKRSLG
ncbi:MAG: hypothetical protein V2I74_10190, partial [Erythrobacter sp.]|nr:hypothetical protein [Erythrobacter sp.]